MPDPRAWLIRYLHHNSVDRLKCNLKLYIVIPLLSEAASNALGQRDDCLRLTFRRVRLNHPALPPRQSTWLRSSSHESGTCEVDYTDGLSQ